MTRDGNDDIVVGLLAPYGIYPTTSGGKKYIVLFSRYLREIFPVHMFTTSVVPNEQQVHPVLGESKLRYANPMLFFTLKKIIEEKKITHLIIEHPYFAWLGWMLKNACGISLIMQSHNIEAVRFKTLGKWWWRLLQTYEGWAHRQADQNFFITEEDRQYAINYYKLNPGKCHCVTYGTEREQAPSSAERLAARQWLNAKYQINDNEQVILFVGSLGYGPNTEAVEIICRSINPLLNNAQNFDYKILICGSGLPESLSSLKESANVIFTGFVKDIDLYFRGADVFINPIISGGGIKTKLVEALGNNLSSVTTRNGAVGIDAAITKDKMIIVEDEDWENFAAQIIQSKNESEISSEFFQQFYWGNIAAKAAAVLREQEAYHKTL